MADVTPPAPTRGLRWRAYLISTLVIVAVGVPLLGVVGDDFPISTFPMFASARPEEVSIAHTVVIAADGTQRLPSPSAVANDEVIQAAETVRQAVRQGPAATARLCRLVADSVGGGAGARVEVVTERFNAVPYFDGQTQPLERVVHASCAAPP